MEMIYCPYFREKCIKENCSAFEFEDKPLFEDKDRQGYEAFKKVQKRDPLSAWWYAIDVPYCRTMKIELPMKKE